MKTYKTKIVITLEGGMISEIKSNQDIDVKVIDLDCKRIGERYVEKFEVLKTKKSK